MVRVCSLASYCFRGDRSSVGRRIKKEKGASKQASKQPCVRAQQSTEILPPGSQAVFVPKQ